MDENEQKRHLKKKQKVFLGKETTIWKIKDLSVREIIVSGALVIVVVWLGIFPRPVINTAKPSVIKTLNSIEQVSINQNTKPIP